MTLIIRQSRIHSYGCYTTRPICKGTLIVEYVGERLTYEQADELYDDFENTYLFGLDARSCIIAGSVEPASSIIPANRTAIPIRFGARCGSSRSAILRPEKN